MQILLSHGNIGYVNAPQWYFIVYCVARRNLLRMPEHSVDHLLRVTTNKNTRRMYSFAVRNLF